MGWPVGFLRWAWEEEGQETELRFASGLPPFGAWAASQHQWLWVSFHRHYGETGVPTAPTLRWVHFPAWVSGSANIYRAPVPGAAGSIKLST